MTDQSERNVPLSRGAVTILVAVLVLLASPVVTSAVAQPASTSLIGGQATVEHAAATETVNTTAPPDPDEDVLGWENGYWHNESITVTRDDGLNDSELDAVVARGMARVEHIRELEFEKTPPVEVISREAFTNDTEQRYANMTESDRVHQNIKYEALFMVGEDESAVAAQRRNQAGGVGGYYDPAAGEIKIISENVTTPKMDEITLSQELFHALQDQKFNISSFNQTTQELHNAKDGLIEGDGNLVDQLYNEECTGGIWNGSCLLPESSGAPSDFDPHLGLYQTTFQPYSSGPPFVSTIRRSGGWEAVNDLYETPPASSEQVIHPGKYGQDEPTTVSVEDTSQEPWQRQTLNASEGTSSVSFAQFGEGGLFVALWYPGFETQGQTTVIPYEAHLNQTASGLSQTEPFLYEHPATAGWGGEKLVPYVTDDSAETSETAYVYKLAWDSETDAEEFRGTWLDLMEFHGAQPVEGHEDTYRISDDREFGDAFSLTRDGDTVTIVNAPTVDDLSLVYDGAAPEVEPTPTETESPTDGDSPTETDTPTDGDSPTETDTPTDGDSPTDGNSPAGTVTPTETAGDSGPGFTIAIAIVALAAVLVAARRSS
jgi:PGF-CTERM protein